MSEQERLRIFDEHKNDIGVASRSEVHRKGYWHEAFHCWFVKNEEGTNYIYLQLRSKNKKDYPDLLDITAAGHLLASETVEDGVREIKEEIGIVVEFSDLISLGVTDYCVTREDLIDKEFANVFLYKSENNFEDFTLQVEEVSGIVRARFSDFAQLWYGERDEIEINGIEINENGKKVEKEEMVNRNHFVPHPISFYNVIIQKIGEQI
ncbi:NUDIX hydrolase [Pseudalkalibacillus sp. SCS-8]|uniref:NUDIX hydrolase n=1 Tax=Pseudalkalibacillus nanhaiensis TaxID=3115291 RepID=UPI0032DB3062